MLVLAIVTGWRAMRGRNNIVVQRKTRSLVCPSETFSPDKFSH
jgi:hypothetical protein